MNLPKSKTSIDAIDRSSQLQSLILLGLGGYLAFLILSGSLSNYINLRFAWLAYVGAGIFFLLGAVNLYASRQPAAHHHHHPITRGMMMAAAFPLLLAILIPSRPLGPEAINGGISLSPVGVESAAAFTRSPLDRNILDWLREFNRSAGPAAFNGQAVDVSGFVYREPTFPEGHFMVARFTMSCCVADAYPIGLPVAAADGFATGEWVRVQGELRAGHFGDDFVPIVQAAQVEIIDEPEQTYLYP